VLLGFFAASSVRAENDAQRLEPVRKRAEEAEKRGAWLDACRNYDELVRKTKGVSSLAQQREEYQKAYQRCLRRLHMFARHSELAYRQTLARVKGLDRALDAYEEIVKTLNAAYPDRDRAELSQLFQQGLDEVALALDDPVFKQHYLADVKPTPLATFRSRVKTWPVEKFSRANELREQVRLIIVAGGKDGLPTGGVLGKALVMEFAAGACNALDEYSSFLTPSHLGMIQSSSSRKKLAGAGLSLSEDGDAARITNVWPKGPADAAKLAEGDRIVSIDGKAVKELLEGMSFEELEAKFYGPADAAVTIEYERGDSKEKVELKFAVVALPSVQGGTLLETTEGIGYLRINYFTEDTPREFKDALGSLMSSASLKGLVLDLRGNPGGSFSAAVQIAELFLPGGVISISQSNHPKLDRTFKVESPGTIQLPLVVLVDGDTASAAEVLAAALKESRTSTYTVLMGQTTYGKGSVQCLIELKKPLDNKAAGIRLTVAKLFSPSSVPISGKGIKPEKVLAANADARNEAKSNLLEWLKANEMMMMPNMRDMKQPQDERLAGGGNGPMM